MKLPTFSTLTVLALLALPAAAQQQPAAPAPSAGTVGDIAARAAAPAAGAQGDRNVPVARTCVPPKDLPKPPDGRTATEAEMKAAHTAFKTYVDQGQLFVTCVEDLQKRNALGMTVRDYLMLLRAQDGMVGNMQLLAERFNEQLRVFKAR